jgi:AcrR family transcriptional regulator
VFRTAETGTLKKNVEGAREAIFRAAEELFSRKRFREVSVRDIASQAGVHFALVAYYFGGKQALFDEVFRSHVAPLVEEGLRELGAVTRGGRTATVEEILRAWVLPCLRQGDTAAGQAIHLRIIANLSHERWEYTHALAGYMNRSHRAFIRELRRSLPHLSKTTVMWRLHFVAGALFFGVRQPASLTALSGGLCDPEDLEATFEQILPYAAAGLRAPDPAGTEIGKPKRKKTALRLKTGRPLNSQGEKS